MIDQSEGRIFRASERGHSESGWHRSYTTFNADPLQKQHKTSFGPLYVLTDHTLAGSHTLIGCIEEDSDLLLIPTTGALAYSGDRGNTMTFEAGECQVHSVRKGTTFEIRNPYEQKLVSFIELRITRVSVDEPAKPQLCFFDIENNINNLIHIKPGEQPAFKQREGLQKTSLGKFKGREEANYKIARCGNGLFAYVIEGAFEIQYRLLEQGDGLSLWGIEKVGIEALSNNAIILLIEVVLPAF